MPCGNETLKFFDLKKRKKFSTDDYKIVEKKVKGKKRRFAVATAPSGIASWRILGAK